MLYLLGINLPCKCSPEVSDVLYSVLWNVFIVTEIKIRATIVVNDPG